MKTTMRILPSLLLACIFGISLRADEGSKPLAPAPAWTTTPASWDSGRYVYDGAGNIRQIGDDRYTYDALGRLKTATAITPAFPDNAQTFDYDRYGNLLRTATTSGNEARVAAAAVNAGTNQLTTGPCQPADYCYTGVYDAAGNKIGSTPGVIDYQWDALGMMTEVNLLTRNEAYVYDANDERIVTVGKGGGSRRFTLRGADDKVAREIVYNPSTTAWTWERDYVYRNGALLAAFVAGEAGAGPHRHYHLDHLGTPRLITDGAGYKQTIQTYWPFGAPAPGGDVDSTERMAFTGHELDSNPAAPGHDLYYMHARYYTALVGRFLSVDPVLDIKRHLRKPQGWNRYAYVENNPVNLTDPTGKCPECDRVAASGCINCQDEIADAVRVRNTQIETQQMADLGDPLASEFASGNGRAEGLGLGPLDAFAFGMSLRAVRAAPALRFASQASFETHFAKHGAEFGFKTAGEYLKGAARLISSAGQRGVQSFTRANGDKVVYRAATNEFAVVARNNVIRTYFKPRGGVEYYVRQLFAAVEEKLVKAAAR